MKRILQKTFGNMRIVRNYFQGNGVIFMLHRVSPLEKNRIVANETLKISPEFLEKWICDIKSSGYTFVSLDELCENLKAHNNSKKQVVCTLDDGYKDNFTTAYPIFKKYSVPFTIYITTSFPEQTAILWWYGLEDFILKYDKIILSTGQMFDMQTKNLKEKAFLEIRNIILALDHTNILSELNTLFADYSIDWESYTTTRVLNWDEIKQLSSDPLVTIGSHTQTHPALNTLSPEEVHREVVDANRALENHIGKKIAHFAYPFGSSNEVGKREVGILKKTSMMSATTTRRGTIYSAHRSHMYALPRIMLTENFVPRDLSRIRRKKIVTV